MDYLVCILKVLGVHKPNPSAEVCRLFFVTVAISLAAFAQGAASASDIELVQRDVRTLIGAVYSGDLDTVIRFTHPRVVTSLGGSSSARATLARVLAQTQSAGMKLESLVFPNQPVFLQGDGRRQYVVVPTRLVIMANGQRLESFNFQFGVREPGGAGWTYMEGSRVTPQLLSAWFPDFPASHKFPTISRKKL